MSDKQIRVFICPRCNRGGGTMITKTGFRNINGERVPYEYKVHQDCKKALGSINTFVITKGRIDFSRG